MKLTKMRGRQLREIFYDIMACYGESKFQDNLLDLNAYHEPGESTYGECEVDYHECSVNLAICRNMRDAVEVLIEDDIHYLQSPTWYTRYDRMYGYWKNPYEIEAKRIAKVDAHLFL